MRTMTLTDTHIAQSTTIRSTLKRIVAAITQPALQWLRQRRTKQALSELSDRDLRDIGVDRSEITTLAERLAREQRARDSRRLGL